MLHQKKSPVPHSSAETGLRNASSVAFEDGSENPTNPGPVQPQNRKRAPAVQACLDRAAARQRMYARRGELLLNFPIEYEHGYLSGFTGEPQAPCDAAGYPIGLNDWPIERRNSWFAGWNLGNSERGGDE